LELSVAFVLSVQPPANRQALPQVPPCADVGIIGAGIIGLSIGWRLAREGLKVVVFDRGLTGQGASFAATGMLAAAAEFEPGGEDLLGLCLESQRLWPTFCNELEDEGGMPVDYRNEGTLIIALGRDEVERLRFRHNLQRSAGLATRWLSGSDVREREPALRPSVGAGILSEQDHQVDPRRVAAALVEALLHHDAQIVEDCSEAVVEHAGGTVFGVRIGDVLCKTPVVIIATGAWTASSALLPADMSVPVRPLKGQALSLKSSHGLGLSHVLWTTEIHLAPKADGRLVVGATVEEAGFDGSITAGGVYALLEGARRVLPSTEDMQIEMIWSGFRPTSQDDSPIIGGTSIGGLVIATGHHRNGVLLAPITAQAVSALVLRGETMPAVSKFTVERFNKHSEE
jgi:glycine oxidase